MLVAQEAQTYAEDTSLLFMETSAKTAMNVNELFLAIGESPSFTLPLSRAELHGGLRSKESPTCMSSSGAPTSTWNYSSDYAYPGTPVGRTRHHMTCSLENTVAVRTCSWNKPISARLWSLSFILI